MREQTGTAAAVLAFSIFLAPAAKVLAQGDLMPPGGPEPSMKTLGQIEPRTPISEPVFIELPGSYYLIHDIVVDAGTAITILADNVTLDLNGFTIRSFAAEPAGTRGIHLAGNRRNITIANGFIAGGITNNGSGIYSGAGFGAGIYSDNGERADNILVKNVSISGCQNNGIHLGYDASVVESCTVQTVGNYGIFASTIKNCIVTDCGNHAVCGDQVSDCRGESGIGSGISATTVQNAFGYSYGSEPGISAYNVQNSYGYSTSGAGISTTTAAGCNGISSQGFGIDALTAANCYGASVLSTGIRTEYTAQNCYGYSSGSGNGIHADVAQNCHGHSAYGSGILAVSAQNCFGYTETGSGINAGNAHNCYGYSNAGGTGVNATIVMGSTGFSETGTGISSHIANASMGSTSFGTAENNTHEYDMP